MKTINIRGELLDLSQPLAMGIANITPDSFYDKSRKQSEAELVEHVRQMIVEGASIIDLGAQSSNPKSPLISEKEESERLRKVLPTLAREFPETIFSIDTFYSEVAKMCVEEFGVSIINDISGGQIDENMFQTVVRLKVPYILMHMQGTPQTMQDNPHYDDVVAEVAKFLAQQVQRLSLAGVAHNRVCLDAGFGFGKSLAHNHALMRGLHELQGEYTLPMLVGVSRKRMIGAITGRDAPAERISGSVTAALWALNNGAHIVRVHDVRETVDAIRIWDFLNTP